MQAAHRLTIRSNQCAVQCTSTLGKQSVAAWREPVPLGTIRGGPEDGLVSATVDVLPAGSLLPLLTAVVPSTLLSTVVVGRTQSLVVLLGPPNATSPPRWLPLSLSTFRDVTLVLHLLLRCHTDRSMTATVSVSVACPGEVQPLASEVKTAGSVAQYSTQFAGPAGGGGLRLCGAWCCAAGALLWLGCCAARRCGLQRRRLACRRRCCRWLW